MMLTTMFQFHNGSIKSHAIITDDDINLLFQFHNGSIKSRLNQHRVADEPSFNSTMVRLKVARDDVAGRPSPVSIPQWFD